MPELCLFCGERETVTRESILCDECRGDDREDPHIEELPCGSFEANQEFGDWFFVDRRFSLDVEIGDWFFDIGADVAKERPTWWKTEENVTKTDEINCFECGFGGDLFRKEASIGKHYACPKCRSSYTLQERHREKLLSD